MNTSNKQQSPSVLNRSHNSTTAEGHYVTYISYLCSHFISSITYHSYTCKRGNLIRNINPVICFTAKTDIHLLRVEFALVSKCIYMCMQFKIFNTKWMSIEWSEKETHTCLSKNPLFSTLWNSTNLTLVQKGVLYSGSRIYNHLPLTF
jgi:hypothetical protein